MGPFREQALVRWASLALLACLEGSRCCTHPPHRGHGLQEVSRELALAGVCMAPVGNFSTGNSPRRYVLKIHFFIESCLKMIQFKIQFKTKSGIFIQKNIHSIEFRIFNRIIHSRKMRKIIQNSKIRPKYGFGALLRPLYR